MSFAQHVFALERIILKISRCFELHFSDNNVVNVSIRDTSPAAIKSEPEEDNGFYPSPRHNKSSKQECDDEE